MKTKTQTKQRRQLRDMDVALMECKDEFGDVLDSDFLDEEAFCLALAEDEE
jgi:hypothetical protein